MSSPAIFNSLTGKFECLACGSTAPAPALPCPIKAFANACNDFDRSHRNCKPPAEKNP